MTLGALVAVTAVLLVVPPVVDRWAGRRSSPDLVITVATLRLVGLVLAPLALAAFVAQVAGHDPQGGSRWPELGAITVIALVLGRAATSWYGTRQHANSVAAAVDATAAAGPAGSLLVPHDTAIAFTTDTDIVVTTALLDCLDPGELDAVLAHERAHLRGRHARLAAASQALARAAWSLPPARAARARILEQLELLADQQAVAAVHDPVPVHAAVAKLDASTSAAPLGPGDPFTTARLACLQDPLPASPSSNRVLAATIGLLSGGTLAAVCGALHVRLAPVGLAVCGLLTISLWRLLRPIHRKPALSTEL